MVCFLTFLWPFYLYLFGFLHLALFVCLSLLMLISSFLTSSLLVLHMSSYYLTQYKDCTRRSWFSWSYWKRAYPILLRLEASDSKTVQREGLKNLTNDGEKRNVLIWSKEVWISLVQMKAVPFFRRPRSGSVRAARFWMKIRNRPVLVNKKSVYYPHRLIRTQMLCIQNMCIARWLYNRNHGSLLQHAYVMDR